MIKNLIYITEGITFQDIQNNKYTSIEVYEKQINNWFIKPAQLLADSSKNPGCYEMELALLTLLVTFFESHGQYLLGKSSENNSSKVFETGFKSYLEYLIKNKNHKDEYYHNLDLKIFYKLVRCGLLHNGYIKADGISFLIDSVKLDKSHVIYPNNIMKGSWLINTINMLEGIKSYLYYYINLVKTDVEKRKRFENMFNTFFSVE